MKSIRKIVEKKVEDFLISQNIPSKVKILLAFSGGPDSTALAHILKNIPNYDLHIVCGYFNHKLREPEELESEVTYIRHFSKRLGIEYEIGEAADGEIATYSSEYRTGIEDAARFFRYRFLAECAERYEVDYIATGHNMDDLVETVLMRVFQGAGIQGLAGIPSVRGKILRPMLSITKSEVLSYIDETELGFSLDTTNDKNDFLRNRIRHDLIPEIKNAFPGLYTGIRSLTAQAAEYNDFIETIVKKNIVWDESENGVFRTGKTDFFSQHRIIRIKSLMKLLSDKKISDEKRITYSSIAAAVSVENRPANMILLKTNDYQIYTSRNHIFVQRLVNQHKKSYLLYLNKDTVRIADSVLLEVSKEPPGDCGYLRICCRKTDSPMVVRNCRSGDKIRIREGLKDLGKLFSEWGVLSADRDLIPVIENRQGVAAVLGEHLGYNNKLADYDSGDCHETEDFYLKVSKLTETTGE